MSRVPASPPTVQRFGLLLSEGCSVFSLACFVQPLKVANRLSATNLYDWQTLSRDGAPVTASNGFQLQPDRSIEEIAGLDEVVVCGGGSDGRVTGDHRVISWLRRLSRHGVRVGAISSGSWLLAHAGMLDGRPCTIHWDELTAFRNTFPELQATMNLFEVDASHFTCGGGAASFDLALHFVAERMGHSFAALVSEQLIHHCMRADNESQRPDAQHRLGMIHPALLRAIETMETHMESPLSLDELAEKSNTSRRNLERLFRRYFHKSPSEYYMALRLHDGQRLLRQSAMPITEIALACGFRSPSHFCKQYKRAFQRTPSKDRLKMLSIHNAQV